MRLAAVALLFGALAAVPVRADSKAAIVGQEQNEPPPANGVDPLPRHGIFAEAAFGIFTTVGGAAGLSNGQPFLSMAVGSTIGSNATLFASLGIGSSSSSCYDAAASGDCLAADSFEAAFLEVGASYGGEIFHRLRLSGKVLLGLTQLAPSPVRDATANTVPDNLFGPHGGLGVSLDYETHLDHFSVGVDLTGRYTLASRPDTGTFGLFSLAFMPRVRYVF